MSVCLVTKSHTTLCDFMHGSPPTSSVCGIFQARILERIAISYSRGSSQPWGIKSTSLVSPAWAGRFFFFFNQCITWKALIRDLPSPLSLVLTKNSEPFLLSRVTGRDWPSCSMTVTPGTSLKTKYII